MKNYVQLAAIALILTGCATPYQANRGFGGFFHQGGYRDTKLQDGTYRISFSGNNYVSEQKSSDYALLRGAELALRDGFKYFTIVSDTSKDRMYVGSNQQGVYTGHKFSSNFTIQCFKEKPEAATSVIYNAEQVKQNIASQYNIRLEHSEGVTGMRHANA